MWRAETIRESTKQTNRRVAQQMEAAHRVSLAKGEVGIREQKSTPMLAEFAERDFLPFIRSTFAAKVKTRSYYDHGVKSLLAFEKLAESRLDAITTETIAGFVATRQANGLEVTSINRELQVLRRMFAVATEWGKTDKALAKVRMLPGEKHRERVLTPDEEARYLKAAREWDGGDQLPLLPDVAVLLIDCGLRPEECFRLRWPSNIRDGGIEIQHGKTENARRRVPITSRVAAILELRKVTANNDWVFPAATRSGHIEPASIKRQHLRACRIAQIERFPLYTLRHTCLTRWAPHMDPWTLAYLAGHRDMAITKRYVHPQEHTIREALERSRLAQSGHTIGHTSDSPISEEKANSLPVN
ncbi:MAG: site-specific integrase [Candidatus Solibacter usitatus]|nr:site-specific integrase [Candidatus Solibacter usitatus]